MAEEKTQVETPAEEEVTTDVVTEDPEVAEEVTTATEEEPEGITPELQKTIDKRIGKAVRKQREAERETDKLRKELAEADQKVLTEAIGDKPNEKAFETYEEYIEALTKYQVKHEYAVMRNEFEADKKKGVQETLQTEHEKLYDDGRKKYDDFDKVALSLDIPYSDAMADAVHESDSAIDLMDYFGRNIAEAERISNIKSPLSAAREVGKIEVNLSKGIQKKVTNAPPPITPVKGNETVSRKLEDMSQEDFRRAREAQNR